MQVNRIGVGLIGFFLLAGLALVVVPAALGVPAEAALIIGFTGAIWIVVALGLTWYARRQKDKGEHQDWIFRNGLKGTATVVKAGSHATVNDMPLMKITVDLDIPGVGSSQVTRREVMPVFTANRIEPGLVLPAYANPKDPGDFILVW